MAAARHSKGVVNIGQFQVSPQSRPVLLHKGRPCRCCKGSSLFLYMRSPSRCSPSSRMGQCFQCGLRKSAPSAVQSIRPAGGTTRGCHQLPQCLINCRCSNMFQAASRNWANKMPGLPGYTRSWCLATRPPQHEKFCSSGGFLLLPLSLHSTAGKSGKRCQQKLGDREGWRDVKDWARSSSLCSCS